MRYASLRLLLAATILVVALMGATTTGAQTEAPSQQQTTTVQPTATTAVTPPVCATPRQHKSALKRALLYSHANGNFVARVNKKKLRTAEQMRSCAKANFPGRYKLMRKAYAKRLRVWKFHRYIDAITPYGAWAVPPAIVMCEGGFHGWTTYNHGGSGAAGPYQLLGWGAPMPATTAKAMAMHHIIAHRLYVSQGTRPWASSSGCWGR